MHEIKMNPLIKHLLLNNINLSNKNIQILSVNILNKFKSLKYLDISNNININDDSIEILLNSIYIYNKNSLEYLDLSNTGITNKTCKYIYNFFVKLYNERNPITTNNNNNSCNNNDNFWSELGLIDINSNGIECSIKWIELKNNNGINEHGIDTLNKIFINNYIPCNGFQICIEGCNFKKHKISWDLSLL